MCIVCSVNLHNELFLETNNLSLTSCLSSTTQFHYLKCRFRIKTNYQTQQVNSPIKINIENNPMYMYMYNYSEICRTFQSARMAAIFSPSTAPHMNLFRCSSNIIGGIGSIFILNMKLFSVFNKLKQELLAPMLLNIYKRHISSYDKCAVMLISLVYRGVDILMSRSR